MELKNLTPHALVVAGRTIEPSGVVARVSVSFEDAGSVDGIPVVSQVFGQVEGLPEPQEGVAFIVSGMVLATIKGRADVFAPDTGPTAIRNEKGHIIGVVRLVAAG
jgi:hypothetical protein